VLEILKYSFFQNALIGWILISIIWSILWVFIVMRKEANITHSISNFLFLGIAISLLFDWNYYFFAFLFWIIWSFLIYFIEKTNFITRESTKEIIAQAWIAWWIFSLWFLDNLTLDINNFLFWSILLVDKKDLIFLLILLIFLIILFLFFSKNFLWIIINEDISRTKWLKIDLYNLIFLIFLSTFIWISIKIFWVLLIWAFLVIPANTSKILSKSIKTTFINSFIISIIWVIFWLFWGYFLWTSSWASVVLSLILIFLWVVFWKKIK